MRQVITENTAEKLEVEADSTRLAITCQGKPLFTPAKTHVIILNGKEARQLMDFIKNWLKEGKDG